MGRSHFIEGHALVAPPSEGGCLGDVGVGGVREACKSHRVVISVQRKSRAYAEHPLRVASWDVQTSLELTASRCLLNRSRLVNP